MSGDMTGVTGASEAGAVGAREADEGAGVGGITRMLGLSSISTVDEAIRAAAWRRLDALTKPQGSLGDLEALAAQVCAVQGSLEPAITAPLALVFAADHGIADRGVSAYPRAVTRQMVQNYLDGGAAISVLARRSDLPLWIVDAGVDGECASHAQLIAAKVRAGTRDFVAGPAMTAAECHQALRQGSLLVGRLLTGGANTVLLGEMGIGNTASAAMLMHGVTALPLCDCVGRGTGLGDRGLERKQAILKEALERRAVPQDPVELLTEYGGYEIVMLVGALLGAAARRSLIVVDGFTVTVAAALAARIDHRVLDYCVFGHCSAERAHPALLAHLQVRPLLDLGLRLGEGSGAALALPLIQAAVGLFNGMATFAGAGVAEKIA